MAEPSVSDALWRVIEPLLPKHPPRPQGGHPFTDDRPCLEGIIHVLRTGCQWQALPRGGPWPTGSTCWRRFRDWTRAGVWPAVHRKLLKHPRSGRPDRPDGGRRRLGLRAGRKRGVRRRRATELAVGGRGRPRVRHQGSGPAGRRAAGLLDAGPAWGQDARERAGRRAVRDRADVGVVRKLPAAQDVLRADRRALAGVPRTGRVPDLGQAGRAITGKEGGGIGVAKRVLSDGKREGAACGPNPAALAEK